MSAQARAEGLLKNSKKVGPSSWFLRLSSEQILFVLEVAKAMAMAELDCGEVPPLRNVCRNLIKELDLSVSVETVARAMKGMIEDAKEEARKEN
jgi:hypothetical protein